MFVAASLCLPRRSYAKARRGASAVSLQGWRSETAPRAQHMRQWDSTRLLRMLDMTIPSDYKSAGHATLFFSVQLAITYNCCNYFAARAGWLRKLNHRRQVAPDGRIKCNLVGIFGKWRCPCRRRAWQVQTRPRRSNQNRNAIRNCSLPNENFRGPDDTARARRFQARVHQNKGNGPLISRSGRPPVK